MKRQIYSILTILMLGAGSPVAFGQTIPADMAASCALPDGASVNAAKSQKTAQIEPVVRFRRSGDVNVLIVLVQHRDDVFEHCAQFNGTNVDGIAQFDGANYAASCASRPGMEDSWVPGGFQSWSDDPITEWPADLLVIGPNRRVLPQWAQGTNLIDSPGGTMITPGSVTDLYDRMSNSTVNVRGHVWPFVYVPDLNQADYRDPTIFNPFPNAAVRLSHEIVTHVRDNPEGLNLTDQAVWDTFVNGTNGEGVNDGADGLFDMIVLLYRFSNFVDVFTANNVTSFGTTNVYTGNEFAGDPIMIGTMEVRGSLTDGSGVISAARTRKQALKIINHEIGHRFFGYYHTTDGTSPTLATKNTFSVMGGTYNFMGAADRIKLEWADVENVDLGVIQTTFGGRRFYTLEDGTISGDVLRIRDGSDQCGDVIVEARTWSNFWDSPPNGVNDDGDGEDYYVPQEGLYLEKAPELGVCGVVERTNPVDEVRAFFSSMENSGLPYRVSGGAVSPGVPVTRGDNFRFGNVEPVIDNAFVPGDAYTPFSTYLFDFHPQAGVDPNLAITNITRIGNSFTFSVWSDYLTESAHGTKTLTTNYAFDNTSLARDDTWALDGPFEFEDEMNVAPGITFNLGMNANFTMPAPTVVSARGTGASAITFDGGALDIFSTDAIFEESEFTNTALTIRAGADVTMTDGTEIRLRPGFHAQPGSNFHAFIGTPAPRARLAQAQMPVSATWAKQASGQQAETDASLQQRMGDAETKPSLYKAAEALPTAFSLSPNYPNPFNPTTTITYALKEDTRVTLKVYNVLGQQVATLVNGFQQAGYKSVAWNGRDAAGTPMPSGTYFYRLVAGDFVQARTMLLVR